MNKILNIVIGAMFAVSLVSCASTTTKKEHSGLFPIKQDGKYGYIDINGSVKIPTKFELAEEFSDGLAAVVVGGKYGYVDVNGQIVVKPQFDIAEEFSEGIAFVEISKKVGAIDKSGKFLINPQFDAFNNIISPRIFVNGIAPVQVGEKVGYIDKTGKFIVNPQYYRGRKFSEGLAVVDIGNRENYKCGYIDETGKLVIGNGWINNICSDFSDGLAIVGNNMSSLTTIDKTGKIKIPPYSMGGFNEGLAPICDLPIGTKRNCGYMDTSGKLVINKQFDDAWSFSEGLAVVRFATDSQSDYSKTGYIDKTGKLVINPQFFEGRPFSGGLAKVTFDNSSDQPMGYIDKTGKIVWRETKK